MSMITATTWIPRSFPAQFPSRQQLNEEEYSRISNLAELQLNDAKEDLQEVLESEDEDRNGGVAVSHTNG